MNNKYAEGKNGAGGAPPRRAVLAKQPIIEVPIAGTDERARINLRESTAYIYGLNERKLEGIYGGKNGIVPLFCEIRYELLVAADGDGSTERVALLEKKLSAQNGIMRGAIDDERSRLGNNGLGSALHTLVQVEQSLVTIPTGIGTYLAALKKKLEQGPISQEFKGKMEAALANVDGVFAFYASFTNQTLELAELLFKTSQMGELVAMWKEIREGG